MESRPQATEAIKARFTYRLYEVSELFKAFKQRFSQYYNTREDRSGPLWEQCAPCLPSAAIGPT